MERTCGLVTQMTRFCLLLSPQLWYPHLVDVLVPSSEMFSKTLLCHLDAFSLIVPANGKDTHSVFWAYLELWRQFRKWQPWQRAGQLTIGCYAAWWPANQDLIAKVGWVEEFLLPSLPPALPANFTFSCFSLAYWTKYFTATTHYFYFLGLEALLKMKTGRLLICF